MERDNQRNCGLHFKKQSMKGSINFTFKHSFFFFYHRFICNFSDVIRILTFINLLYSDAVSYAYTGLPNFLISSFTVWKEKKYYLNKHSSTQTCFVLFSAFSLKVYLGYFAFTVRRFRKNNLNSSFSLNHMFFKY